MLRISKTESDLNYIYIVTIASTFANEYKGLENQSNVLFRQSSGSKFSFDIFQKICFATKFSRA